MLGARTKQVLAYGKRSQRVVNVSDEVDRRKKDIASIYDDLPPPQEAPVASKMRKREDAASSVSKPPTPKLFRISRKNRASPSFTPARKKKRARVTELVEDESCIKGSVAQSAGNMRRGDGMRIPLAMFSVNVPASPSCPAKGKKKATVPFSKGKPPSLKKADPPVVDIQIIVLDDDGHTISKERRTSRTDVQVNPIRTTSSLRPKKGHATTSTQRNGAKTDSAQPVEPGMEPRASRSALTADESEDPVVPPPRRRVKNFRVVSDVSEPRDSDGESPILLPARPTSRRAKSTTVYSDESESEPEANRCHSALPSLPLPKSVSGEPQNLANVPTSRSLQAPPLRIDVEVVVPPIPYTLPEKRMAKHPISPVPRPNIPHSPVPHLQLQGWRQHITSPIPRARQLTPIRKKGFRIFEVPSPPTPSTPTDFDLSLEFSGLDIGEDFLPSDSNIYSQTQPNFPQYLLPLLRECGQESCGPYEFSAFIEAFPSDPVVRNSEVDRHSLHFQKIGEASYSEVFGIGDVVLKIIPLFDGGRETISDTSKQAEDIVEGPPPSDAKDVLKEIIVTRAMGEVSDGFISLLKSYVVRGRYPELLLKLWDDYFECKGSESIRPDTFLVSQMYAIIILPNGGPDLEAYNFPSSKTGWRQACSLFWQVSKSLAHAEQLVSFEHRDLHWGQVLVKSTRNPTGTGPLGTQKQNKSSREKATHRLMMDDLSHGVKATLIDLGLARMDAGDGCGGELVHWTPFDEEIFMGEGDFQFDVYRFMRDHIDGAWGEFHPLTNVMWLNYLARKLLRSKRLKSPSRSRESAPPPPSDVQGKFTERDCFECLTEIEKFAGIAIANVRAKTKITTKAKSKSSKTTAASRSKLPGPSCAGDIVAYGVKKGWIMPLQ